MLIFGKCSPFLIPLHQITVLHLLLVFTVFKMVLDMQPGAFIDISDTTLYFSASNRMNDDFIDNTCRVSII